MGAADPTWPARPPEANDLILKAGTGVGTMVANEAAWTAMGASHHASATASTINTAVTSASWLGAGSAASAANVTMQNTALHGLGGWVDVKPAVVQAAVMAFETANAMMRPAAECQANRDEWAADNAINPAVFFTLTPRIVALDVEYFGVMWPNNAAVGTTYGATLSMLTQSLLIPAPPATMGASPAAPAAAASAVSQAAAETAAGGGMRAAHESASAATSGTRQGASAAQEIGGQVGSLMGPVQQGLSSAMQAPSSLAQMPQSFMGPAQSAMGMFMNPSMLGALGAGGAGAPATAAVPAANAAAGAGSTLGSGGGAAGGAGGVPASTFTRPVSAFEAGASGRPVGMRPSGALGVDALRAPTTTTPMGGGMGGMPVGHAANALRGGEGGRDQQAATVRVVDDRV
ncbi:PPE family protein [Mycolicibacterium novocastrense]|uniref:PPE family protein n=1 Tax=Mycolicibacterium novocastrense TaxID=59813 RepID=A0AAW5SU04_MYCNV|nr:PPE family protein [Mycolicibacterium novocastrense]MCV7026623.1 PPE family protein [Mycolicibacterium novocastrense]GAT07624.1 PPE family protein [Mycolicibacterium novocastrense]